MYFNKANTQNELTRQSNFIVKKLLIIHESPCIGGAEFYLINLVRASISKQLRVVVLLCEGHCPVELEEILKSLGADVMRVELGLKRPRFFYTAPKVWKLLKALKPDYVFFNKRINWYDFRHMILTAWLIGKARLVAVEHWHPEGWPVSPRKSLAPNLNIRMRLTKLKCRIYANCLDVAICMNNEAKNIFQSQYGYPLDKLKVIYNGVDLEKFTFDESKRKTIRENLGVLNDDYQLVVAAGRLSYEKGFDTLLDAWALLPEKIRKTSILCVAGEGPENTLLQEMVIKLDVSESVVFMGQSDDMPGLLSAADIFVAPSRRESFGLSIAEAMAVGCCVVSTKVGGIPELLGDTGVYVESESATSLSQTLQHALTESAFREEKALVQNLRVRNNFSLEQSMQSTLDLIQGDCNACS